MIEGTLFAPIGDRVDALVENPAVQPLRVRTVLLHVKRVRKLPLNIEERHKDAQLLVTMRIGTIRVNRADSKHPPSS